MEAITAGQKKQYKRFVDDAADKVLAEAGIDKDGLQKLIENGDDFQSRIMTAVRELSVSNRFADEEVSSRYGYLSGYQPKPVAEQIKALKSLFPNLGTADIERGNAPVPAGAEGWFAIPRWQSIAPTYGEAVEKVLALIASRNGKFYNYREGCLGPQYLRQHARTEKMFQKLGDQQKDHDILVIPAQFGIRHRGRSVRRVREVMNSTEFGLGAFAIGVMLLTHPERLKRHDDLWIDCAGDEFAPLADGDFSKSPLFYFNDDKLRFGTDVMSLAFDSCGSVSGFVPQN